MKVINLNNFFKEIKNIKSNKYSFDNNILEYLQTFTSIIIWGVTESAEVALDFLNKNNIKVNAFYDDNESKQGSYFKNIPILKPNYKNNDNKTALIIACSYYETIKNKLIKYDKNIEKRLFIFDGYFLEDINYDYFYKNKEKITLCYKLLKDKKSKDLLITLLKYRYLRNINLIKDKFENRSKTYFDSVFLNNFESGLIIDAGSYNADFIVELAKKKDISNCEFYIFEPNKDHAKNIKDNLSDKFNFKLFEIALCDKKSEMLFSMLSTTTSHLIDPLYNVYTYSKNENVKKIKTNTIDNIVKNKIIKVIKADVEGSEQLLLKGAKNTIIKNRPILLLSAYHRCSDLWELLDYINNLELNYSFYLRHYSLSVAKTILYCIPNK